MSNLMLFAANLTFIVAHIYGWLLKWYYKPAAYSADFNALFPAQRAVGTIYLLQVLELPYLLQVGNPDALLYANAFALLIFSFQMLVMCELYFFPARRHSLKDYWIALPAVFVLIPLFLNAILGLAHRPPLLPRGGELRPWAFALTGLVFAWYFWRNIRMALRIGNEVRRVNEATYADTDDFPVRFAQYIQWVPTLLCVLLAANFIIDDPVVKAVRDLLFTIASIIFCIYTLNPQRKPYAPTGHDVEESAQAPAASPRREPSPTASGCTSSREEGTPSRLSDERYGELRRRLEHLLADEGIYTEPHITADTLMQRLGINANYLSEVIRRSGYSSFYDMVNQHRVRLAISLIRQHPDRLMRDIAEECGFASPSSMTKAFASQGKEAPSSFRYE